jgi:hypothetical protein
MREVGGAHKRLGTESNKSRNTPVKVVELSDSHPTLAYDLSSLT